MSIDNFPYERSSNVPSSAVRSANRSAALHAIERFVGRDVVAAVALMVLIAGIGTLHLHHSTAVPTATLTVFSAALVPVVFLGLAVLQIQTALSLLRDGRWLPVSAAAVGSVLWVATVVVGAAANAGAIGTSAGADTPISTTAIGWAGAAALTVAVAAMPGTHACG